MPLHAYFSHAQVAVLQAALNRLIPEDEFPGAWEAGVADYLEQQFARDLVAAIPIYQVGLTALDAESEARLGNAFAEFGPAQQDEILGAIERGDVKTDWPTEPRRFMEMLVNHAAEGFYSDPGNGGNRNKSSWQMIGFLDRN